MAVEQYGAGVTGEGAYKRWLDSLRLGGGQPNPDQPNPDVDGDTRGSPGSPGRGGGIPFGNWFSNIFKFGAPAVTAGIQAWSSNKGAKQQSDALKYAADLEYRAHQDALAAAREQQDYDRWLTSATSAARKPYIDALAAALGAGFNGGYSPSHYDAPTYADAKPFQAPSRAEAENDPSYQFALSEGRQGVERSAGAKGTLLTTGTLKDLDRYSQDAASAQYDKVYNRALQGYSLAEGLRGQAFDRNASAGYNAAALNNQSAYHSASLAQSQWGAGLAGLGTLAGYASPGPYPGSSTGGNQTNPGMPADPPGYNPDPVGSPPVSTTAAYQMPKRRSLFDMNETSGGVYA